MVDPTMVFFPVVFVSSLLIISCIANVLYLFGYLCVLGCRFHCYILMTGLIYSCTSSTLVASPASQVFTLGSLGVSGLNYDGSAGLAMVALLKISESSLSYVMVLSLKGE